MASLHQVVAASAVTSHHCHVVLQTLTTGISGRESDRLRTELAEAAEAASDQGAFWEMHDLLFDHQDALNADDLIGYADQLELDVERFASDLRKGVGSARVADDVDSADLSGVNGTPTFFINGRRHYGAYDIDTLSQAVRAAGARAMFAQT